MLQASKPSASYDLLNSPELTFLDYFNFKDCEAADETLFPAQIPNAADTKASIEGSNTPICCGEAFFSIEDFMNHFDSEHKNEDLTQFNNSNVEGLDSLRSNTLTPSLQNGLSQLDLKKDETYFQAPLLATISEADEPIIVAAPNAKRPRVISVSQGNKKVRESEEDLVLALDEWNTPTVDPSNMGYINSPMEQFANYWNTGDLETGQDYVTDYFNGSFEADPIPNRSFTAPPYVGEPEVAQPRRYSTYSIDDASKRFECPKPFCSKVYKNSNGLKYHLEHGNCEMEGDEINEKLENESFLPDEIRVANRPYFCKVDGCGKKYKNLNGLKYHAKTAHPRIDFKSQVKGYTNSKL